MPRKFSFFLLVVFDAFLVNLALICALMLRFDGHVPVRYLKIYITTIPIITIIRITIFYVFGLYNRIWNYASIGELLAIIKAVSIGSIAVITYIYFDNTVSFPRSVMLLSWILNILFIGGVRFSWRILINNVNKPERIERKRILIIGAGDAGAIVAKELLNSNLTHAKPVGFIDDDEKKLKMQIYGIPVLGIRTDIPFLVKKKLIDEIIIAMPSVDKTTIRELVNICKQTSAKLKILPGIYQLIDGRVSIKQIREVQLEDLLGRDPIKLDIDGIAEYLNNKVILITGAGGSIGSELCRQIIKFSPTKLIMLDNNENNVYEVELELKEEYNNLLVEIADIKDKSKISYLFTKYKPQVVFHAAAHKHVPLMETNPEEAIKNNVFGTRNVAEAADRVGTEIFLLISTDKAVHPTSFMGASKRIGEMLIQSLDQISETRFVAVRFGNVLGSKGSVIPIFKKQISQGGPVTVTHPEMIRYFMTIPEAVQLVIQTGALAQGGEIFVLDMGEPVKIYDLAKDLITLSGLEPEKDIEIVFKGVRPGEKLYEELLAAEEGTLTTKHERILVAKPVAIQEELLHKVIYQLNTEDNMISKNKLKELLCILIPTFRKKLAQNEVATLNKHVG